MFSERDHGTSLVRVHHADRRLLRLLLARQACDVDPIPSLPENVDAPNARFQLDLITSDQWLSNWNLILGALLEQTQFETWPFGHKSEIDRLVETWRSGLTLVPARVTLTQQPAYQYYQAVQASTQKLPEHLIVLPVAGFYVQRVSLAAAITSRASYQDSSALIASLSGQV